MNPRIKCCVLCSVLLFMLLNAGRIECSGISINTLPSPKKVAKVHAKSRKLMELNVVLDYDYAGPNPKHEPRGKKGGGGATKNP
ncbi:hypothetical protein C2S52_015766 [Perilla frutescens var. hirtella]|nr:hypothetical protein C2S52_015766 [Perilla frutescens var. hirtella]